MDPNEVMDMIKAAITKDKRVMVCEHPAAFGGRGGTYSLVVVLEDKTMFRMRVKFDAPSEDK